MKFISKPIVFDFAFSDTELVILMQAMHIVSDLSKNVLESNTAIDSKTKELIVETDMCLRHLYDLGNKES